MGADRAAYNREYNRLRRKARKEAGLCTRCPEPAAPDRTLCKACQDRESEWQADRMRSQIEAGLCSRVGCKLPPEQGTLRCAEHREYFNGKTREAGLKRESTGLCNFWGCDQPPVAGRKRCEIHAKLRFPKNSDTQPPTKETDR